MYWRYVSIDSIRENHVYSESEQNLFKVFAQLLVNIYKRYMEELRQSGEKYRLLFEYNPEPIWIYDVDTLTFLEVNNAAINHYGYSRKEFLSMTLFDICPPVDIPEFVKSIATVKDKKDHHSRRRHITKKEEIIYVELNSTPKLLQKQTKVQQINCGCLSPPEQTPLTDYKTIQSACCKVQSWLKMYCITSFFKTTGCFL